MRSDHGRKRATAALVLAAIAVFFSLGGVGLAKKAVHLISGTQIKKGSIALNRLSPKAVAALKGQTGPKGDTGSVGPKGEKGDRGSDGVNGSSASSAVFARINGVPSSNGTTNYGSVSGTSNSTPGQAAVEMVSPSVPITIRDIHVHLTAGPGTANRQVSILWSNASTGDFDVIGCYVNPGTTDCENPGATTTVEPGSTMWVTTVGHSGTATATDVELSWRATG